MDRRRGNLIALSAKIFQLHRNNGLGYKAIRRRLVIDTKCPECFPKVQECVMVSSWTNRERNDENCCQTIAGDTVHGLCNKKRTSTALQGFQSQSERSKDCKDLDQDNSRFVAEEWAYLAVLQERSHSSCPFARSNDWYLQNDFSVPVPSFSLKSSSLMKPKWTYLILIEGSTFPGG